MPEHELAWVDVGFDVQLLVNPARTKSGADRGYIYKAEVARVVDGDTVILLITLATGKRSRHSCRLFGINTNEHDTSGGDAATEFLRGLLPVGTGVVVATKKDKAEKFGRILGTLTIPVKGSRKPVMSINDQLVASGHALPWNGQGAKPV
jgi:endonuclease YncB( thermonuclease family)